MIGDPGQGNIALAFIIRKFDDLDPTEKLYLGRFQTEINTFATKVTAAIKAFKVTQRAAKAALEEEKNKESANDKTFGDYLFGKGKYAGGLGYIEQLRKIGMSATELLKFKDVANAFTTLKQAVGNVPVALSVTLLDGKPVKEVAKRDEKRSENVFYNVVPFWCWYFFPDAAFCRFSSEGAQNALGRRKSRITSG